MFICCDCMNANSIMVLRGVCIHIYMYVYIYVYISCAFLSLRLPFCEVPSTGTICGVGPAHTDRAVRRSSKDGEYLYMDMYSMYGMNE